LTKKTADKMPASVKIDGFRGFIVVPLPCGMGARCLERPVVAVRNGSERTSRADSGQFSQYRCGLSREVVVARDGGLKRRMNERRQPAVNGPGRLLSRRPAAASGRGKRAWLTVYLYS
jgi:hypothetical protein